MLNGSELNRFSVIYNYVRCLSIQSKHGLCKLWGVSWGLNPFLIAP